MKKALAVGDRVRVYEATLEPWVGKVVQVGNIVGAEYVHVKAGNETYQVHPLQCRRLRKRERLVRWIYIGGSLLEASYQQRFTGTLEVGRKEYRLEEVPPGSVVVTREELAKAWDEKVCFSEPVCPTDESSSGFHVLCKALGFKESQ